MSKRFIALGIGNNWITAILAKWARNSEYYTEGFAKIAANGFSDGSVVDFNVATKTLVELFGKVKRETGKNFHDVYATVSSSEVRFIPTTGVILLSKYGREVTSLDVAKCIDIGSTVKLSIDEESIHRNIDSFTLDGQENIKNPINLEGVKLKVKMNVLSVKRSVLNNLAKCTSQAGCIFRGTVFSALACSGRVLKEEDKVAGTALLNIYSEMTELVIFHHGVLIDSQILPFGIKTITNNDGQIKPDILEEMNSQLKLSSGWGKVTNIKCLCDLLISEEIMEAFHVVFNVPCTIGACLAKETEELPAERMGYIKSLGVLDYLQEEKKKNARKGVFANTILEKTINFLDSYF